MLMLGERAAANTCEFNVALYFASVPSTAHALAGSMNIQIFGAHATTSFFLFSLVTKKSSHLLPNKL